MPQVATVLLALMAGMPRPAHASALHEAAFELAQASEVVAVLTVSCQGCSWAAKGREGAVLLVSVDGRHSQHLILSRGEGPAPYEVTLGALKRGAHRLTVTLDRTTTPAGVGASVLGVETRASPPDDPEHVALAHAPRLYARPDTIGRFSDVPLLMWYESERTTRGTWLRYSVIFSNEDGGTPTDRLMATWGRVTDIEYVYGVELDAAGRILAEEYQGPEHEMLPFRGRRDGRHPRLWVVTRNNMVSDRGATKERYAPAPVPFRLDDVSREAVMDANPWTYRVSDEEMLREERIDESARPGSGRIPDPRRFVYLEACGELEEATLAFDVAVNGGGGTQWIESDGGLAGVRIARSGCFRGAVALPPGVDDIRLEALRFRAYTRSPREGEPASPKGKATARLFRVNRLFRLGPDHEPGPSLLRWQGEAALAPDGAWFELPIPR